MFTALKIAGLSALVIGQALAADYVWWEAEDPVTAHFPPQEQSPFHVRELLHPERLSGGDWISGNRGNTATPYSASYQITVPANGQYAFWVRKCWHHALFTWEFDNGQGPSGEVTRKVALTDGVELRPKISAHWVDLGQVRLSAGTASICTAKPSWMFSMLFARVTNIAAFPRCSSPGAIQ